MLVTYLSAGSNAVPSFVNYYSNGSEVDMHYSPLESRIATKLDALLNLCESDRTHRLSIEYSRLRDESVIYADKSIRPGDSPFCFQYEGRKCK